MGFASCSHRDDIGVARWLVYADVELLQTIDILRA